MNKRQLDLYEARIRALVNPDERLLRHIQELRHDLQVARQQRKLGRKLSEQNPQNQKD